MRRGEHLLFFGKTRKAQLAFFKLQIEHLVEVGSRFEQGVLADDADIRDAVLHIGGHVGGFDKEKFKFFIRRFEHEFARFFFQNFRADAAFDKDIGAGIRKAALCQRNVQHFVSSPACKARRTRVSPTANPTADKFFPNWAHNSSYRPPESTGAPTPSASPVNTMPE